jgi:hypothetical protein
VHAHTRDGTAPLLLAAQEGHVDACRELLALGADPNRYRADGAGALYKAAQRRHTEVVRLLLAPVTAARDARDADSAAPDAAVTVSPSGSPAGSSLARHPSIVCTALDPVAQDGLTPLFVAVINGDADTAALLLEAGARPEPPAGRHAPTRGRVPLHVAAARGDEVLCRLLVRHGAKLNAADAQGVTPAVAARARGHPALAQWLASLATRAQGGVVRGAGRAAEDRDRSSSSASASASDGAGAGAEAEAGDGAGEEQPCKRARTAPAPAHAEVVASTPASPPAAGSGSDSEEAPSLSQSAAPSSCRLRLTSSTKRIRVAPRRPPRAQPAEARVAGAIDWLADDAKIMRMLDLAQEAQGGPPQDGE